MITCTANAGLAHERNAGGHRLTAAWGLLARVGAVGPGRPVAGRVLVGWWVVGEGDLEVDLDSPAADADVLDHEPEQPLAAVEVEVVERGDDPFAEPREPMAQPVLGGQLGAAGGECLPLARELVAADGQRAGPAGQLVELEETGLVGVKQPRALTVLGVDGCVQTLELGGDELVLVGRAGEHGVLAGEQLLWVKQRLADLPEHVLVERVTPSTAARRLRQRPHRPRGRPAPAVRRQLTLHSRVSATGVGRDQPGAQPAGGGAHDARGWRSRPGCCRVSLAALGWTPGLGIDGQSVCSASASSGIDGQSESGQPGPGPGPRTTGRATKQQQVGVCTHETADALHVEAPPDTRAGSAGTIARVANRSPAPAIGTTETSPF